MSAYFEKSKLLLMNVEMNTTIGYKKAKTLNLADENFQIAINFT